METSKILKKPILTEKTYKLMGKNVYTFLVNKNANQIEIAQTVEFIFNVKVAKVNIINVKSKPKRLGRFVGVIGAHKKAIVKLASGEINFFPDDTLTSSTTSKEVKKTVTKKEMSEAEKRAAAKIAQKLKEKSKETTEVKVTNVDKTPTKVTTTSTKENKTITKKEDK